MRSLDAWKILEEATYHTPYRIPLSDSYVSTNFCGRSLNCLAWHLQNVDTYAGIHTEAVEGGQVEQQKAKIEQKKPRYCLLQIPGYFKAGI